MYRLVSLFAATLFTSAALAAPKLTCTDGMSFGAGRVLISEDEATYTVLLRGYESHGRTVGDLARDFGLTLPNEAYLSWVGVTFSKASCTWVAQDRPVAGCLAPNDTGEVVFYSGWDPLQLQEVARKPAEVILAVDQLSFGTVAPDGYYEPGATLQTSENTRGTIYVTATNGEGPFVYRSTVSVQMESHFCR